MQILQRLGVKAAPTRVVPLGLEAAGSQPTEDCGLLEPQDPLRHAAAGEQSTPRALDGSLSELQDMAESLSSWASSLAEGHAAASRALQFHAETLRRICGLPAVEEPHWMGMGATSSRLSSKMSERKSVKGRASSKLERVGSKRDRRSRTNSKLEAVEDLGLEASERPESEPSGSRPGSPRKSPRPGPMEADRVWNLVERTRTRRMSVEQLSFREQAARVVESGGQKGEYIDDLVEIPIADIEDKHAISYWRFCQDMRLYRSKKVTEALRLICAAPVPGLGDVTYLQVFDTLTRGAAWEHHIYLFGGLVRDILRRTVGNDIDIGFSAPAGELEVACGTAGYVCDCDGDYIVIGDANGEEYLEGMVISFNGIQPPEHADFSMNTLFYDFKNDIVIDKTGTAVPAVMANRCDLPCPRDRWKTWIEINGVRVFFRYYKFVLRGYEYSDEEMLFVVQNLLEFWNRDAEQTIEVGRVALGGLVGSTDADKIEILRQVVHTSFAMTQRKSAQPLRAPTRKIVRRVTITDPSDLSELPMKGGFLSADDWWKSGWLVLLKL